MMLTCCQLLESENIFLLPVTWIWEYFFFGIVRFVNLCINYVEFYFKPFKSWSFLHLNFKDLPTDVDSFIFKLHVANYERMIYFKWMGRIKWMDSIKWLHTIYVLRYNGQGAEHLNYHADCLTKCPAWLPVRSYPTFEQKSVTLTP